LLSVDSAQLPLSAGARRLTYSYTTGGSFLVYDSGVLDQKSQSLNAMWNILPKQT